MHWQWQWAGSTMLIIILSLRSELSFWSTWKVFVAANSSTFLPDSISLAAFLFFIVFDIISRTYFHYLRICKMSLLCFSIKFVCKSEAFVLHFACERINANMHERPNVHHVIWKLFSDISSFSALGTSKRKDELKTNVTGKKQNKKLPN